MSDRVTEQEKPPQEGATDTHRESVIAQTLVREIFQSLIKHGRTTRLYGAGHQHTQGFLKSFVDGLESFLKHQDLLFVEIEPDQIIFQGKEVLSSTSHGELLIYGLYSEGARAIGVDREAPRSELEGLADLLSQDWHQRSELEDDLVAATWRREFEHVHIDVADRFSEEDEFGDAVIREDIMRGQGPGGKDSRHARGDSIMIPEIQGILAELEAQASQVEGTSSVVRLKQDEAKLFLSLQDDLKNTMSISHEGDEEEIVALDPTSQAELSREIAALEAGEDHSPEMAGRVIFEVLRLEDRESQVGYMARQVARHCTGLCADGDLVGAANLMRGLLLLCDPEVFPSYPFAESIRRGYSTLIQEQNRVRLLQNLPKYCKTSQDCSALFSLLSLLGRNQLSELVRLGADIATSEVRQVIADIVILMVQRDEEALVTLLVTGHEEEAIVPLMALGRLESPAVIEESLRRMGSPNAELREACMRALRGHNLPRVRQEMLRCLKDDEPSIRIEALRYLAVYRQSLDLPLLESTLRSPKLGTYEPDEIRAWIKCYAIVGRNESIKLLRQTLEGTAKVAGLPELIQGLAIEALVALDTPEAQGALEVVGRKDEAMKRAILKVQGQRRGGR